MSRRKGHAWEREVAQMFREWGFPDAKRHLEFQLDEGGKGLDLSHTGPLKVQAKNYAGSINPLKVLEEIEGEYKMAFIKRTGKGWFVALSPACAEYLIKLCHQKTSSESQSQS